MHLIEKKIYLDGDEIKKNFIFVKYYILMKTLKQNLKQNPMKPNPIKPNLKQMNPKQIARMWRKIKFLILILNPTQNQMLK